MRFVLFICFYLLLFFTSFSQTALPQFAAADSVSYKTSIQNAINIYHSFLSPETRLYNGGQYVDYTYTINEGNPFFLATTFSNGSIFYDSVLYNNVGLLYDMVRDAVVITDPSRIYKIKLNNEKIISFSLLGHTFIRLVNDSAGNAPERTGFYDVLYNGNIMLLKKEKKTLHDKQQLNNIIKYIQVADFYYIKKNNTYFSVRNKKSILDIFKDRKKELEQYIRKNKIHVRNDIDGAFTAITAYYDKLNNYAGKKSN